MDTVTEVVRTIAAWIPVNDQQLDDMPALAGIINTELLYDLDKLVEELAIYGDGAGENFDGIIPDADVLAARVVAGPARNSRAVVVADRHPHSRLIQPSTPPRRPRRSASV